MAETTDDLGAHAAVPPPESIAVPPPASAGLGHVGVPIRSWVGVKLAAAMFLHHFSLGAWIVTLSSYVDANTGDRGSGLFTAGFVGAVYGAGPVGGMVAPFLTGLLADHFFATERIMAILHLVGAAALGAAIVADSQLAFYLAALVYFLSFIPSFALLSSMTFHHLARPERDFPIARAWSTGGWVASGVVVGWLWPRITGQFIETTNIPMKIALISELVLAAFCLVLPHTPPTNKRRDPADAAPLTASHSLALLHEPRFLMLMLIAVVAHVPTQFFYAYFNVFLNAWAGWTSTAAKMTIGQLVEIACMLLLPAVLLRVSVKTSIVIGLAVWTARLGMIAASTSLPPASRDAVLYAVLLLHGFAFTMVSISLQMEVDRNAGPGRRATAQGLLSVAMSGLGCFIGAGLSGIAGARLLPLDLASASSEGWRQFWLLPTALCAAVLVFTAVFLHPTRRERA